jgi:tetratricopeptide (TPR) repeat protein
MAGTTNREAFLLYIEAERLFTVVSQSDMEKCRDKFRIVTEMDPLFARAWGWRSYTHVRSVLRGWLPESAMIDAGTWAQRAVEYGPHDYATHWDLAFYYLNSRQFQDAIKSYEKGIELYDHETDLLDRKPGILAEAGEGFIHVGSTARAVELLQRAMHIPDWYRWNLGFAYYQDRRPDEALAVLQSMRAKPGDRSYVPDAVLFTVIAYYRKAQSSLEEGDQDGHDHFMEQAVNTLNAFKVENSEFTLQDALAHRSRFQNKADEDYWFEPLAMLWNSGP